MSLAELIFQKVQNLSEPKQTEILDFVEFLNSRKKNDQLSDDLEFNKFSISSAMRGMENEDSEYNIKDLKE